MVMAVSSSMTVSMQNRGAVEEETHSHILVKGEPVIMQNSLHTDESVRIEPERYTAEQGIDGFGSCGFGVDGKQYNAQANSMLKIEEAGVKNKSIEVNAMNAQQSDSTGKNSCIEDSTLQEEDEVHPILMFETQHVSERQWNGYSEQEDSESESESESYPEENLQTGGSGFTQMSGTLQDAYSSRPETQELDHTDRTPSSEEELFASLNIPNPCQVCLNGFKTLSKMKEHMMTHSDYKGHQCAQCSAAFKRRSDLKRHLRQHTGEKPFVCPTCDYACSQSAALQQHVLRRHKGQQPYQCAECKVGFQRASDWKKHLVTHKASGVATDIASTKEKGAVSVSEVAGGPSSPSHPSTKPTSRGDKKQLQYEFCITKDGERRYQCSQCDASYKERYLLKIHYRKHSGERPYKCSLCPAAFAKASMLAVHVNAHTGKKLYQCDVCGAQFVRNAGLRYHKATRHGSPAYPCTECPLRFVAPSQLRKHLRVHSGEKPFQCSECSLTFKDSYSLKSHARRHTGEKPYQCNYCHLEFRQRSVLTVHMRRHTDEKPYHCPECPSTFRDATQLKVHIRTHTGERPYQCPECPMTFARSCTLKKHMDSIHRALKQKGDGSSPRSAQQATGISIEPSLVSHGDKMDAD